MCKKLDWPRAVYLLGSFAFLGFFFSRLCLSLLMGEVCHEFAAQKTYHADLLSQNVVLVRPACVTAVGKVVPMLNVVVNWILSALSLIIVAHVIRGFEVSGFVTALIASIVIGFVNATVGLVVKILTFPLTLVSLGVFWFVINALMLKLASALVPGFNIQGFLPAFLGAIVLSLVNLVLRMLRSGWRESRL